MVTTVVPAKDPEVNLDWKNIVEFCNVIKNKSVREFTLEFLNTQAPDYFARIPASATGKYHPAYALGMGGLLRHSLAVATIAYHITQLAYLQLTPCDKDCIIAASLLHDTFKQGLTESGNTVRTHPEIAAKKIMDYGKETGREQVAKILAGLVISHMGEFGNHKPGNRGQFIVHLADYLASRKNIDISYDFIFNEVIKNDRQ